jgi:hypothetical protein
MTRSLMVAFTIVLCGTACRYEAPAKETSAGTPAATQGSAPQGTSVTFTAADLDKFEAGFKREIEAVKAAQKRMTSATTAQERGEAIQAQFEFATIPAGAAASGLAEARYREIREGVDRVLTTLDFQDKIDGPLSIDLSRADDETKKRVSGDAFADLPSDAAAALRARMDRLVPVWVEYKKLVAVAG